MKFKMLHWYLFHMLVCLLHFTFQTSPFSPPLRLGFVSYVYLLYNISCINCIHLVTFWICILLHNLAFLTMFSRLNSNENEMLFS